MPMNTYQGLAPREPKVLTVFCRLSSSYNYEFTDVYDPGIREQWLSVSLTGTDRATIHGYARKGTPLATQLMGLLHAGGRWITLEVEHKGQSPHYVHINRLVE